MLRFWPHTHTHEHRLHINRSPLNNFYNPHPHIRLFMYTYIKKRPASTAKDEPHTHTHKLAANNNTENPATTTKKSSSALMRGVVRVLYRLLARCPPVCAPQYAFYGMNNLILLSARARARAKRPCKRTSKPKKPYSNEKLINMLFG